MDGKGESKKKKRKFLCLKRYQSNFNIHVLEIENVNKSSYLGCMLFRMARGQHWTSAEGWEGEELEGRRES